MRCRGPGGRTAAVVRPSAGAVLVLCAARSRVGGGAGARAPGPTTHAVRDALLTRRTLLAERFDRLVAGRAEAKALC